MLSHPLELLAITIGTVICAAVLGVFASFIAGTIAGIIQF
jgi:hypothetical protein